MYEHRTEPLIPVREFWRRIGRHFLWSQLLVVIALMIGTVGYNLSGFKLVDSFLNASMLLGGMGPIGDIPTTGGKIFASFYALFAGLIFISVSSILFAPVLHRVMHKLHLDEEAARTTRKKS
ncbi:MAG: hypothetical protein ABIZ70_13500 [Gemmatimonadales bacterium]